MGRAAKVQSFFESAMTDFTEQLHNTIEIQKIMGDSITISNPCNCRRQNTSNSNNMNTCVKYVRVNVCQDTIVAKSTINDSIR